MLTAAFAVLGIAVALGAALFILHLRGGIGAPRPLAVLHGLIGIGGLSCLILALRQAPLRTGHGTTSFGVTGAALIAAAALVGVTIFVLRSAGTARAGTLIGIHATLAVSGFVILAAYVLV